MFVEESVGLIKKNFDATKGNVLIRYLSVDGTPMAVKVVKVFDDHLLTKDNDGNEDILNFNHVVRWRFITPTGGTQ